MGQLNGKVALVTGSARGIGKAVATGLAREGASLVIGDKDTAALQDTGKLIAELGVPVEAVSTDVTDERQIENLFSKGMDRFGRLDILVNNAGIFYGAPLDEITTEGWDRLMNTSLRGTFLCTRAAFRIMKKAGGGRILNIGSISGIRVRQSNAAYNTAKFGITGLTHSTALDGRNFGITCGCIYPGEVLTERFQAIPSGNNPRPSTMMSLEDIAASVVYMACLPPNVNILELVQLHRDQPFLARG